MAVLTASVTGHLKTLHRLQDFFYILYKLLIPSNITGTYSRVQNQHSTGDFSTHSYLKEKITQGCWDTEWPTYRMDCQGFFPDTVSINGGS